MDSATKITALDRGPFLGSCSQIFGFAINSGLFEKISDSSYYPQRTFIFLATQPVLVPEAIRRGVRHMTGSGAIAPELVLGQ